MIFNVTLTFETYYMAVLALRWTKLDLQSKENTSTFKSKIN